MQKINKYYNKRITEIVSLLEKPERLFSRGTFHDLRVEIKKINALFELVNFYSKDFKRGKTFSPFKKLFKQAGKIRGVQVERSILEKYFKKIPPSYKSNLRQKEKSEKKIFFKLLRRTRSSLYEKTNKSVLVHFKNINKKKLAKYLNKQANKINRELEQKPLTAKRIHAIRKMLKSLLYINAIKKKNSTEVKQQAALSVLLGKWHDFRVIIKHTKKILANNKMPQREAIKLKKIITKLNLRLAPLYKQITKVSAI